MRKEDGSIDKKNGLSGRDLVDFVNNELVPYFQGFKDKADSPETTEYKIAEIFSEIRNKFSSGYLLREVLAYVRFNTPPETRRERVDARKGSIFSDCEKKEKEFLDFVLGQYIEQGVSELDTEKLPPLIDLKYTNINDARKELGKSARDIRKMFMGF